MATIGGAHRLVEPMIHSCGFESYYPTGYAMHAKHCDGTRPATEGRIAARDKTLAVVPAKPIGRPRKDVDDEKVERRREQYRKSKQRKRGNVLVEIGARDDASPKLAELGAGLAAIQGAATDKAIEIAIAGLMAKRDRIDVAIAALQAVG